MRILELLRLTFFSCYFRFLFKISLLLSLLAISLRISLLKTQFISQDRVLLSTLPRKRIVSHGPSFYFIFDLPTRASAGGFKMSNTGLKPIIDINRFFLKIRDKLIAKGKKVTSARKDSLIKVFILFYFIL